MSLAIAALPEEFPLVYTLYLALGAWRLARQRALVRRLPAVETLGSTTVICTDKTGTLTEGSLSLARLEPLGVTEEELLDAALLACEPTPFDPLEVAIETFAGRAAGGALVVDHPFDAGDKYLTHVWERDDGRWCVAAKGSLEGILAHAEAAQDQRRRAYDVHEQLARDGLRVLAIAAGELPTGPTGHREDDEAALRLVGLVAFADPVRAGVAEALQICREAGIRVIVITGDHPTTAHAVVESLGLPHGDEQQDRIATGADLDAASVIELDDLVSRTNVFARTRPEQKHLLVQALRTRGEVVAMTGDGINDAPALREADIGVAMGERGTEVARESADMVLLDDNFATIVAAVRDGRRVVDNLAHAFTYLIAFHPPLLLAALVVPLLGKPLLLLPVHLVALELLLHPVISLVFEADPASGDVMHRPPVPATEVLGLRRLLLPFAVGLTTTCAVLGVYLVTLSRWPVEQARAAGFVTLLVAQPFLILGQRAHVRMTRTLVVVLGALVAITFACVYVAPLASLLVLERFPPATWIPIVGVAGAASTWPALVVRPWSRRNGGAND